MSASGAAGVYRRCRAEVTALLDARAPVRAVEGRISSFAVDADAKAALWLGAYGCGGRLTRGRAVGEGGALGSCRDRIGQTATAQICGVRR